MKMTLGEKIKEARKQCGLSQEQLAEKMAVSRSAVAKWEANNGLPDIDNLKALAQLLNVSIDYLLDDGEVIDEVVMREPYTVFLLFLDVFAIIGKIVRLLHYQFINHFTVVQQIINTYIQKLRQCF